MRSTSRDGMVKSKGGVARGSSMQSVSPNKTPKMVKSTKVKDKSKAPNRGKAEY